MREKKAPKQLSIFKNKIPSIEKINANTSYAFTLNPEEQPEDYISTPKRFRISMTRWQHQIQMYLNKCKNMTYNLYMEISCGNRWHFHGDITIIDPTKFYIFDVPRLRYIGAFEIDTIGDADVWDTYALKQFDKLEPFLTSQNVEINITNDTKLDVYTLKSEIDKINEQKITNIYDDLHPYSSDSD